MKYSVLFVIVACVYSLDIDIEEGAGVTSTAPAAVNEYSETSTTLISTSSTNSATASPSPSSLSPNLNYQQEIPLNVQLTKSGVEVDDNFRSNDNSSSSSSSVSIGTGSASAGEYNNDSFLLGATRENYSTTSHDHQKDGGGGDDEEEEENDDTRTTAAIENAERENHKDEVQEEHVDDEEEDDPRREEEEKPKIVDNRHRQQKDEENGESDGGPSFAGLLNGLFDTLTETATSNDCPGKCVHLLAAFICDDISKSDCPNGLKCCMEKEPEVVNTTTFYPQNKFPSRRPPGPQMMSPNPFYRPQMPPQNHFGQQYPGPFNGQNTFRPPPAYRPYGFNGPPQQSPVQQQQQKPIVSSTASNEENSSEKSTEKLTETSSENVPSMRPPELMRPQHMTAPTTTTTTTTTTTEQPSAGDLEDDELETDHNVQHVNNAPEIGATPPPIKACPGVCVAAKMTRYCDAVLNIKSMCKDSLRCCVPFDAFEPHLRPSELIIMNSNGNQFKNQEDDESDDEQIFKANEQPSNQNSQSNKIVTFKPATESNFKPVTQLPNRNLVKVSTLHPSSIKSSTNRPVEEMSRNKATTEESMSSSSQQSEKQSSEEGGVEEEESENDAQSGPPCPGECHSLIAALFCDKVDHDAFCADGRQCCVNLPIGPPPPPHGGPPPGMQPQNPAQSSQMQPPQNFKQQPPPPPPPPTLCDPRYCFPRQLYNHCQRTLPFECQYQNSFCCYHPIMLPPPPPPPPVRTTPAPTTTSTTPDYEEFSSEPASGEDREEIKPPCPGSCINALLSFTCFNQAEMTEIFNCPKIGTKCCAPKTAIKEHTELNSTANQVIPANSPDKVISVSTPKPHILAGHQPQQPNYIYPQGSFPYPPQQQHPVQQPQGIPGSLPNSVVPGGTIPANYNPQYIIPQPPPPPPPQVAMTPQQQPSLAQFPPPPAMNYPPPATNFVHTTIQPVIPEETVVLPQSNPGLLHHGSFTTISQRPPISRYVCGIKGHPTSSKRRRKRVVGGKDSLPGEWCWQVALINSQNQYLCGGALIGTQWVLTAAHCVTNIVRSGDAIYVRVGDHDLTSKYGSPGAQTLRVATTYIHHNHNSQTLDNDIALLKLQGQAALKEGVCLVCLPARGVTKEIPGKRCTVTGYGYMGEHGPIPLRVREATLPIVAEKQCLQKVNVVTEKEFTLPASSFCAGGELRNDACQGDGGGPLVCQDEGFYELTGLVSWGFGCGRQNVPGVYVKVSSFIGWINQIISVNNN